MAEAGPPSPAEDAFRPTVTQAFFTKDLQRVLQDAELGTSTLEMEAIRTPPKMWIAIGGGIAALVVVIIIIIIAASPDKGDASKNTDTPASNTSASDDQAPPATGAPPDDQKAASTNTAADNKPADAPAKGSGKAPPKKKPASK
jgi:hypothetical protein